MRYSLTRTAAEQLLRRDLGLTPYEIGLSMHRAQHDASDICLSTGAKLPQRQETALAVVLAGRPVAVAQSFARFSHLHDVDGTLARRKCRAAANRKTRHRLHAVRGHGDWRGLSHIGQSLATDQSDGISSRVHCLSLPRHAYAALPGQRPRACRSSTPEVVMDILAVAGAYVATICPLLLVVLLLGGVLKMAVFAPAKVQRPSARPTVRAHRERTQR